MIALLAPLAAQAAALVFAPPLDRAIDYGVSEVRQDGDSVQRFAIDRRVTFRATPDGFTAKVETIRVTGAAGPAGRLFEAMTRSMVGRHVTFHLDRSGTVTAVDDLDAVWDAQMQALSAALTSRDPGRAAAATALLAPLRELSPAARLTRMAEMITPIILERPLAPGSRRTIKLPARGQAGTPTLLPGTEEVSANPDGTLMFERHASGDVAGSPTKVSQRRRIDPRTNLVLETVVINTVETAGHRLIVTRSTAIAL